MNRFPPEAQEPSEPNNSQPDVKTMVACAAVEALVPAYSIGATDPEETNIVNSMLAACPTATTELASFAKLSAALLYSAPPVPTPAGLEERLRAALRSAPPVVEPPPSVWTRIKQSLAWLPQSSPQWAAAGVILLLLALNIYAINQNRQLRAQVVYLAQQQMQYAQAIHLLAATNPPVLTLPAVQENSPAQAQVRWDTNAGVAVLNADAFPPLPANMAYQLWLRRDGERSSAGIFTVDQSGTGWLVFPINQPLDSLEAMGITPEPAGGSPGPTGDAVVRLQLQ